MASLAMRLAAPRHRQTLSHVLAGSHWHMAARVFAHRFSEDRLSLVASSLTFTTTLALVPLLTIALAMFAMHPSFANMQALLQQWLVDSLMPTAIAKQVMQFIQQFTSKAHRLGAMGLVVLSCSAFALVLTIDTALNRIWRHDLGITLRVRAKRWGIYALLLLLGPLFLAASLTLTTYALMYSKVFVGKAVVSMLYAALEFVWVWLGLFALYKFVPLAKVKSWHALIGAGIAAFLLEVTKKILTLYLLKIPTLSLIYGAFSVVPILLMWTYMAWLIVLMGAELTVCVGVWQCQADAASASGSSPESRPRHQGNKH